MWLLSALLTTSTAAAARDARPNVVLILTDDQGYGDVGVHGNSQIHTPHLDRFAKEGIRFRRFYVNPVCAPTRASIMTGRDYYRTGVIHTSRGGAKMSGDEVTIAELLRDAGYATGIFGKWHLGDNFPMRPQDQGFTEVLIHKSGGIGQTPDAPNSYFNPALWHNGRRVPSRGYCTDVFTDAALDFIGANRERPFFVYLATNAPHTPLEVAPQYSRPYETRGLDATTSKVYGMITNIDDNFGRLLARLDELSLRGRTLVIFMGDNGPQQTRYNAGLRGRKSFVYEGGIRVPCFVQWPDRLPGGREIDSIAAHIDILPTLAAACGVDVPRELAIDGANLLPLLAGEAAAASQRMLYFQCHRGLVPQRFQNAAVVTQRYKLVAYPGTFGDEDLRPSDTPVLQLFDLLADPGERDDLATRRPDVLARLRGAYDDWFDNVRASRRFTPGQIVLGTDAENPAHLCRYQDGTYRDGAPRGWSVDIARGGRYELTIVREKTSEAGRVHVSWAGQEQTAALQAAEETAILELSPGSGTLDVWFQAEGAPRVPVTDNSTLGDVTLRRLD